jgi:hypothetical protein
MKKIYLLEEVIKFYNDISEFRYVFFILFRYINLKIYFITTISNLVLLFNIKAFMMKICLKK